MVIAYQAIVLKLVDQIDHQGQAMPVAAKDSELEHQTRKIGRATEAIALMVHRKS